MKPGRGHLRSPLARPDDLAVETCGQGAVMLPGWTTPILMPPIVPDPSHRQLPCRRDGATRSGTLPHVAAKTLDQRSEREIDIIRSTYRMMADLGSHRLTLVDVAAEAGVSKALVLYHFGTKNALLHTTMQWALERTADRIRRRLGRDETGAEAMTALIDAVFVDADANRDFFLFYLDLVEHGSRVPEFGELFSMVREIINGLYAEIIEAGIRDGSFAVTDPDAAARDMRSMIEGTFLQWMQTDDWHENHGEWRDSCRVAILTLLGSTTS